METPTHREYTILIDSNEQRCLLFPATLELLDPNKRLPADADGASTIQVTLHTERRRLDWADYTLVGYESVIRIERKANLRELATNLFKPARRRRFEAELAFLSANCRFPVLLLLGTPRDLLTPSPHLRNPAVVLDRLLDLLRRYRLELLVLPNDGLAARHAVGEWAAHLMIRAAMIADGDLPGPDRTIGEQCLNQPNL